MRITAKFNSQCPTCSQKIEVGSKVEWMKGEKARHVVCASSTEGIIGAAELEAAGFVLAEPEWSAPSRAELRQRRYAGYQARLDRQGQAFEDSLSFGGRR